LLTDRIASVAFSPDGQLLATGSNAVRVWDLKTGETVHVLWRNDERYAVVDITVAFDPDGQQIAASVGVNGDSTIRIWDSATGKELRKFPGFSGQVLLAFSPDGRWLVAASRNEARVRRWDLRNPNTPKEFHLAR